MNLYDRYENTYAEHNQSDDRNTYVVRFKCSNMHCQFTIWDVELLSDGTFLHDGIEVFVDLGDVPPMVVGSVIDAGWANIRFGDGMLHVADIVALTQVTHMIEWCYSKALTMIDHVDTRLLEEE